MSPVRDDTNTREFSENNAIIGPLSYIRRTEFKITGQSITLSAGYSVKMSSISNEINFA